MSLYFKLKQILYPTEEGYLDFIPQFRLEVRSRDANDETALEMRTADPLWMLGRQWQFGEFRGEDNGSPINAVTNHRREKIPYYALRNSVRREELNNLPLEAKVEAIEVQPIDLRSKVRIGQKFEALIEANFSRREADRYIRSLRDELPLRAEDAMDAKSRRFFNLMKRNVIDGGDLWKQIQDNNFPSGDFQPLESITEQLQKWYRKLFLSAGQQSAWHSQQLHHQFSVQGEKEITLNAPDYQSGHLDWYSFDNSNINIKPKEESIDSEELMPVNVSFAAMPSKRLFAFEDSQLDLAGMEVERNDLARLMIIDFSLVSGSDWFMVPLEMELGELCWVNEVRVKDVFGVTTIISQEDGQILDKNPLKTWDAFKIRDRNVAQFNAADHFLYLAPVSTFRQESQPLEDLLFLRDEYANMVWAIEKKVLNEMGKASNGYDLHLELNGPFVPPEDKEGEIPKFRLASPVPTNWIPYLPFQLEGSNKEIELRQASMMSNEPNRPPEKINPISWLAGKDLDCIREEAIPRAGVRVQLTKQRIRWTDGETYIWLGRKVLAGKGEGNSGLTFDQLV